MSASPSRCIAVGLATVGLVAGLSAASAQSEPSLSALTVPAARLPEGCRLTPPPPPPTPTPTPDPDSDAIVRPVMPRHPELPSNPWFGTDFKYILMIRPAFNSTPLFRMPDGPPLEPEAAARLRSKLTGDIAEAYSASYEIPDKGHVNVMAVRYVDAKWATPEAPAGTIGAARSRFVETTRIVRGSTVILVTGTPQHECLNVIRSYIQTLK